MKSAMKSGVLVGVAILAATLVAVTVADEPAENTLQGSWNDYPAKWIENSKQVPTATPTYSGGAAVSPDTGFLTDPEEPQPPAQIIPPGMLGVDDPPPTRPRPPIRPPIQQQQSSSGGGFGWGGGKTGGGFNWGGGKDGGGFNWGGGKDGGGFNWGKTRPPQSQQGSIPSGGQATPNQDQLLEQIRELQRQNAMLKALLQRLAEQQAMNGGRSPGLPSTGVPID
jgi:hypothetical protein